MSVAIAREPERRALAAFSSRDFRLLWGGQAISFTGDAAFTVALGWRVTDLTGSAGSLGYVLALESLAGLATLLLGGVLADRYSRRRLMIASDLARAVVVGVFLAVDLSGHPRGRTGGAVRHRARARRGIPLRRLGSLDLDRDRGGGRDPDVRDGALHGPPPSHRPFALRPRRRLLWPALQPDVGRDGPRL